MYPRGGGLIKTTRQIKLLDFIDMHLFTFGTRVDSQHI